MQFASKGMDKYSIIWRKPHFFLCCRHIRRHPDNNHEGIRWRNNFIQAVNRISESKSQNPQWLSRTVVHRMVVFGVILLHKSETWQCQSPLFCLWSGHAFIQVRFQYQVKGPDEIERNIKKNEAVAARSSDRIERIRARPYSYCKPTGDWVLRLMALVYEWMQRTKLGVHSCLHFDRNEGGLDVWIVNILIITQKNHVLL